MAPHISIVTPTHNRPALLLRTLRNVQAQRFSDWEMLVVDDGDGTGQAAAQSLGDPRIKAFKNTGKGQVDARNHALSHATGRIVHLLDDDDQWQDCDHLLGVAQKVGEDDGLAYRGGWLVHEHEDDGRWIETKRLNFDPPVSAASLRQDNTLLCSGVAYPRSLHAELGLFDPALNHYWDWDWYLRVTQNRRLQKLGPPVARISVRASSTSANPQAPDYVSFLSALAKKHGLNDLVPKNHLSFATE
jgi:glycosyltransferase involved in cell wall biosynthesis